MCTCQHTYVPVPARALPAPERLERERAVLTNPDGQLMRVVVLLVTYIGLRLQRERQRHGASAPNHPPPVLRRCDRGSSCACGCWRPERSGIDDSIMCKYGRPWPLVSRHCSCSAHLSCDTAHEGTPPWQSCLAACMCCKQIVSRRPQRDVRGSACWRILSQENVAAHSPDSRDPTLHSTCHVEDQELACCCGAGKFPTLWRWQVSNCFFCQKNECSHSFFVKSMNCVKKSVVHCRVAENLVCLECWQHPVPTLHAV